MFNLTVVARGSLAPATIHASVTKTPARLAGSRLLNLVFEAPSPYGVARIALPFRPNLKFSDATGRKVFPAAAVLLSAAVGGSFTVENKKVLELGAGVHGAVGRTLRQWWPSCSVTLTDGMDSILDSLRSVETEGCTIAKVDWFGSDVAYLLEKPDLVVGSDIIYNPALMAPLAQTLRDLLHGNNCEAWIALEERDKSVISAFENEVARQGLKVNLMNCSDDVWERAAAWIRVEGSIGTMCPAVDGSLIPQQSKMWLAHVTAADDLSRAAVYDSE